MPFDPSQPFTPGKPGFDPSQPFTPQTPQTPPNNAPLQQYMKQNLQAYNEANKDGSIGVEGATDKDIAKLNPPKRYAESYLEALEAGFQTSVTGLVTRNKLPDTVLPENAGTAMRLLSGAGQLAGDVPAMVAGAIGGGVAGTAEAPVLGTVAGATAGMWGLPPALRRYYMDSLQKGEVKDFSDFFERAGGVALDGLKGAVTGVLTEGLGGLGGQAAAKAGAPIIGQTAAKLSTELGVMTTVGKAMDGQVPHAQDFLDGALLLAGMHGVAAMTKLPSHVSDMQTKLQEIYAETGVKPSQVTQEAMTDPTLKQQIMSTNKEIPNAYKPLVEKPQPNQETLSPPKPERADAKVPPALDETHPSLNAEFSPDAPLRVEKFQEPKAPEPPKEPPNGEEPPTPTDKDKILGRIGESSEPIDRGWNNWYTQTVDYLNPLARLRDAISGGKDIPKGQDPRALLGTALSRGFYKADEVLNRGYVDDKGNQHDGMKQILARFPDDEGGLKAYGIAKRAIELEGRGIETGVDSEAAKNYVKENSEKYEQSFRDLVDLQNHGLKNLRDSGIISHEQYQSILPENKDYFPFNRAVKNEPGSGPSSSNPIKNIKGSELKILDPFERIIRNQYAYYRLAEENIAKQSIVDLGKKFSAPGELISKSPTVMRPIEVKGDEIAGYLSKYGIHEGDPENMTIFRPLSLPLRDNEFAVMENGKREVYTVDPSVSKALQSSGYTEPHAMIKIAAGVAKAQRVGITENPFFLLTHAIRDQFSATIQSQNGYRFGWDGLRGLSHYFTKSDDFMTFLRNGGGMSTLADFDKNYVKQDVWGLSKKTGLLDKALNVVKTPFELQHALAQMVFTAPKMGEYLRAVEAGKDPFTATYEGRNVTVDVQKRGASPLVNTLSGITPFFNMRLQGMDRMVQAFQDDATGTAARMALAITLPSLALWWAYKDDPRYQKAANWEKDLYWVVPIGDEKTGTTMRIPKPFEPGLLFGSLVERTMQEFYDQKPDAFKGFGQALYGNAFPNFIPPAIMAPLEQFANRSWLTGGNIVPDVLAKEAPSEQFNAYTTQSGKMLAKAISYLPGVRDIGRGNTTLASPMVLENYIRAWTGNTGMYALQLADKALEVAHITPPTVKPTWTLGEIPYIKSFFIRYPSMGVQPIQDFYDNLQKTNTTIATARGMAKRPGGQNEANDYLNSYEGQANRVNLNGIAKMLSVQNKMIQSVYADPSKKPDEKRQLIDGIYNSMIQAAQAGNKALADHQKQLKIK